jgi:T5SS/PEP-CTERM-associated repeat protein
MRPPFSNLAGLSMMLAAVCALLNGQPASGASIWRGATDGLWSESTNWSTVTAPTITTGSAYITNSPSKTVLLDGSTPASNLWVSGLNVWAPPNTTNTLRLADLGTGRALVVSNATLTVTTGGAIDITNASLMVIGRFISFNMWGGRVTLEQGSIISREEPLTTNVTVITRIGRTNEAILTINGGSMDVSQLLVGESPGAQFRRSRGIIRLNGGSLDVRAELSVGHDAGCTGIVQVAGGTLNVINNLTNIMRVGDFGTGSLSISNGSANIGNLSVGRHDGALGTLTLLSGGELKAGDDVSVGRFSGATGLVLVAGGTLHITNNSLWIGREGHGQLVVSNGLVHVDHLNVAVVPTNTARGSVLVTGGMTLLNSNLTLGAMTTSTGQVQVTDGDLVISNESHTAHASLLGGTLTLTGGSMRTDLLDITNSAAHLQFAGGTLRSGGTHVANGRPFVVGDGTRSAAFEMLGGTHVFPNGLVISRNATLLGCGTIVGNIMNQGTIATNANCGGTVVPPTILVPPASLTVTQGSAVTFSVTAAGSEPRSYQWWHNETAVSGQTQSNLTLLTAQAADAGSYHVVVSNAGGSVTSVVATLRVLVPPQVVTSRHAEDTFSLTIESLTGLNYVLEYKDTLDAPLWISLGTKAGTGSLLTLSDSPASHPARFYRVRVE